MNNYYKITIIKLNKRNFIIAFTLAIAVVDFNTIRN